MQKEEYLIKNACYSVTKYYLCKRNNKRSLLGRKQRNQVTRSFPNRYQYSYTEKVTSLFSIRYILIIILQCYSLLITQLLVMVNDSICYFETYRLINAIIQVISLSSSGIMRIPLERVIGYFTAITFAST